MSVKDRERYDENVESPSEAGSLRSLYADHEIYEDLVIGPVEIWKPKVTLKFIGTETTPKETVKTVEIIIKPPYSCQICKIGNIKHYSCALCEKIIFGRVGMIRHLRKHSRPKKKCKLCNKVFKYAKGLERHVITHSDDRPFSCNICKKRFKRETTLFAHKYTHENKKPYKCEHCTKSFTFKGQLQAHSRLHTGEKPYKCNICSKEFTQQTSLNNHLLKHKGIKPHHCELCPEQFRQVSNLKQHLETRHSEKTDIHTKKKEMKHGNMKVQKEKKKQKVVISWYTCKKCKFMFSSNDDLSKHKKLYHYGWYRKDRNLLWQNCCKSDRFKL